MKKENTGKRLLFQLGGLSCMILIAYSLITMLIMAGIGGPPVTIEECFSMLKENRLYGLLRLDILTVFSMPLYYLLFYSIFLALRDTDKELLSISTIFIFAGLTLFLATPSVFSYLYLSDEYAKATIESDIIGFFLPTVGIILMTIAGPLYLLWFPLVGVRLFKLKNRNE